MSAQENITYFYSDCQANLSDEHLMEVVGTYRILATVETGRGELDQIIELAETAGQHIKRTVAATSLEKLDRRAAQLAQDVSPQLQKHGTRPFTVITPFGRLKIRRTRLIDKCTRKTCIPSALLWQTKQNRHIVTALAQSACKKVQKLSFRESQKALCDTAKTDVLMSHSTVWNLKQTEREHLENIQQQFINDGLAEHRETLEAHGLIVTPEQNCTEIKKEEFSEDIQEQAKEMFQHFTSQSIETYQETDIDIQDETDKDAIMETPENPDSNESGSEKRKPRCVAEDVILVQADEDVTKSQENGRKQNKTYTATIEDAYGHCEYLVARSSVMLQHLVGVILVLMGLFKKKRLEVISDGASWIALWIGAIIGVEVCHILCWYHLCKKVCHGLSGLGGTKERRELLQREILGYLWKGDVSRAVEKLKQILPECRVASRVEELIDYLTRKSHMIVDYESRHAMGYWIASTRVERWNGIAISNRCKHQGMSWTESGVLAIGLHAAEAKRKPAQTAHINTPRHTSP